MTDEPERQFFGTSTLVREVAVPLVTSFPFCLEGFVNLSTFFLVYPCIVYAHDLNKALPVVTSLMIPHS